MPNSLPKHEYMYSMTALSKQLALQQTLAVNAQVNLVVHSLFYICVIIFKFFLTVIYLLFYTIVCHGEYSNPTGYVGFSICLHFMPFR